MRRSLDELAPTTIATYRTRVRKLHLKIQAGEATPRRPAGACRIGSSARCARERNPAARTATEVGLPMRPRVAAPGFGRKHPKNFSRAVSIVSAGEAAEPAGR